MVQQVSIRNEDTNKTTKTFLFPPSCFTDIVVVPHLVIATRDHLCNLWIKALNGLRTVTESVWEGFFVVAYNHIMYLFFLYMTMLHITLVNEKKISVHDIILNGYSSVPLTSLDDHRRQMWWWAASIPVRLSENKDSYIIEHKVLGRNRHPHMHTNTPSC